MVSAKNFGLRLPTSTKGETWGEANTHFGCQPKKHCRAASGLPTTKHKPTHKKPTPPATKTQPTNASFFALFF
jgi:hypothetical protein